MGTLAQGLGEHVLQAITVLKVPANLFPAHLGPSQTGNTHNHQYV